MIAHTATRLGYSEFKREIKMSMLSVTRVIGFGIGLAVTAAASAATSTAPTINFNMTIGSSSATWLDSTGLAKTPDSTIWNYSGQTWTDAGGLVYEVYADPDPILGFDFSFFNNTAATQTFNVVVTLPVTPWANGTLLGASIGASVTDTSGNGNAVLSAAGATPIFQGYTDWTGVGDSAVMSLFDAPFSLPVAITGGTSIDSDIAGLPVGLPGPMAVTTNIAIELNFDLTAGDRASFTGAFLVEYVPAPAGALAFVGLGFLGRRRRA